MLPTLSRRRFLAAVPAGLAVLASSPGRLFGAGAARIRVGCQANAFPLTPGDFPALLAALRTMKEADYAGFECNLRFVQDQFGRLAEARKQIDETGVELISTHQNMQLAKPEVLPRWVEAVATLGASAMVMSGNGPLPPGKLAEEAWRKKAAELNRIGQTCRAGGLRLAYHNHTTEFAGHNAEMNALAGETDPALVSFLMDAGHAYLGGGDPTDFMAKHAPRIFGCHLKTFKGGPKHQVPLGQGDWEFDGLAAAIAQTGWTGWLLTEEEGPSPTNTTAIGPDRKYIRRVFGV